MHIQQQLTINMSRRILIIGAGGFIGGYIAEEALSRGYEVYAGVRPSTSRHYLTDPRLKFVEFDDWESSQAIGRVLQGILPEGERFDAMVYNLGATKCTDYSDFNRINYGFLRNFLEALRSTDTIPGRLVYMSSLSVLGPGDEREYTPLGDSTIPNPDTRYGVSKLKAETLLDMSSDIPWTILRPTGVYGPHDKDYRQMIVCIDRGWDFSVGYRKQMLTFIYAADLARAIMDALESPRTLKRKYVLSEPRAYTQAEFRRMVAKELGKKVVVPVRMPLWAVYAVSAVAEKIGVLRMKPSTLNRDKYHIMRQRNWMCDCSRAVEDFGFSPRVSLAEGVHNTVAAYLEEKKQQQARKK